MKLYVSIVKHGILLNLQQKSCSDSSKEPALRL